MASSHADSSASSSAKVEARPQDGSSTATESARNKIMALLEDSDDESSIGKASPSKIASFFSSPPKEQGTISQSQDYDLDLNDEPIVEMVEHSDPIADEEDDDGSAAYERMLKRLAKPTKALGSTDASQTAPSPRKSPSIGVEHDSEDEIPVRKSKFFRKTALPSSPVRSSSPALPENRKSASPGLFVSPAKSQHSSPAKTSSQDAGSDSDGMPSSNGNPRLQQLIAKKRAEREAKENQAWKEAREARKSDATKQKKVAKQFKQIYSSEMDDGMTDEARAALAEQSRPMRKASKKALEEMNRETQRMARNQQLTHQAKVKTKLRTADFLKTFGYSLKETIDEPHISKAHNSSDNEGSKDTPPSSPPSRNGSGTKVSDLSRLAKAEDECTIHTATDKANEGEEPKDLRTPMLQPVKKLDKGKTPMSNITSAAKLAVSKPTETDHRPAKRIRVGSPVTYMDDSDDDLEIVPAKKSRFAVFDKLPEKIANESRSMLNLRALAHMGSSVGEAGTRNKGRSSITPAELQIKLKEAMYKQTLADKQEKLDELRRRGIVIPTEEEREQDQLFVENTLEQARKDAMELAQKEKATADKEGKTVDENYALPSDDESEDGDWEGEVEEEEDEEEPAEVEIELSGSENEEAGGEDDEDGASIQGSNVLVNDAAEEDEEDEEMDDAEHGDEQAEADFAMLADEDEQESSVLHKPRTKSRKRQVVMDEEEEDEVPTLATPVPDTQPSQINAFGFEVPQSSMGLTQMFKGTMADLNTQITATQDSRDEGSLDFLNNMPIPTMPLESPLNPIQPFVVHDSQSHLQTPSKPPIAVAMTPTAAIQFPITTGTQMSPTRLSEIPDPTQDVGFESFGGTAVAQPYSTVETVMVPVVESPVVRKKGRLHRRSKATTAVLSDDEGNSADGEAEEAEDEGTFELTSNAFDALFKANRKAVVPADTFDKKNSRAKNMIEEQAEESDDEYHGLGGASDDESGGEMDEEMKAMIDEGPVNVDEAELAKFYVEKERVENEKNVDKLYNDIMTGALRKKRAAGGVDDLSDDSDEEVMERRRQKQREFARMRRALLEDENLGKIAENPKKLAFLKAIEDRDEEDNVDLLDFIDEDLNAVPDSQKDTQAEAEPQSLAVERKRTFPTAFGKENVAPKNPRRTAASSDNSIKRPHSLAEIKQNLSFLIDEPLVPDSQVPDASSADEEEDEEQNENPRRRRRIDTNGSAVLASTRPTIINRLRTSTSSLHESESETQHMAFHTTCTTSVFKVPALLRRATTNMSTTSTGSASGGGSGEVKVRRGGSSKSNIHFQAREAERLGKEEKRKREMRERVVRKGKGSVLGRSLGGRDVGFE